MMGLSQCIDFSISISLTTHLDASNANPSPIIKQTGAYMNENPELHPDRYGGDDIYETKKVAEHWHSEDMYRGWLVITIEKYCSRYGKKDDRLKEAYKIANYGKFLVEFEEKVAAGMNPKEAYHQVEERIEPEENYKESEILYRDLVSTAKNK